MSHLVEIRTEVRDAAAVQAACYRLGLAEPVNETVKLFSAEATGLAVRLPDWRYPIVCDLASGQVKYDNFGDHIGWTETAFSKAVLVPLLEGKAIARYPATRPTTAAAGVAR